MTQPPDDRGRAPGDRPETPPDTTPEPPGATPSSDTPTVAWAPPDAQPPDAQPPDAHPTEPPVASGPLISASPASGSAWTAPAGDVREIAPGLVFADTLSRFLAFVMDSLIVGLLTIVIAAIAGFGNTRFTASDGPLAPAMAGSVQITILGVAIGLVYFVGSWSGGRRATPGQRIFQLQVGNAFDGRPLALEQAVRRWLGLGEFLGLFALAAPAATAVGTLQLVWVFVLFVTTATSPTKQGLHDRFANTAVVRPTNAGRGLALTCLVVLAALFVLAVAGLGAFFNTEEGREILRRAGGQI